MHNEKKGGFTLVEAIAAIVILGFALATALPGIQLGLKTSKLNEQRMAAHLHLQKLRENNIGLAYEQISAQSRILISGQSVYYYQTNITQASGYLKEIEIIVDWTNHMSRTEQISVKFRKSKRTK